MSQDSDFQDDPYRDEFDETAVPAKRGWSTGAKIALIVGICAGVLMLVCCGAGGWLAWQIRSGMTTDAAEIAKLRGEIVTDIDVPDELKPQMGMNLSVFGLKVAIYADTPPGAPPAGAAAGSTPHRMLMLLLMPSGADPDQMRREMEKAMGNEREFQLEAPETKSVTIDGEMVDFKIAKGKSRESGDEIRQVVGMFTGHAGPVMVIMIVAEKDWDEEKAVAILESIKK